MVDAAKRRGIAIDVPALQRNSVPVVETVAVQRDDAQSLVPRELDAMRGITDAACNMRTCMPKPAACWR